MTDFFDYARGGADVICDGLCFLLEVIGCLIVWTLQLAVALVVWPLALLGLMQGRRTSYEEWFPESVYSDLPEYYW